MRHKRWIALAVLPALLLAGDFFYWRLAVSQLREGFEAWTGRATAAGWTISHGSITAGGWPDAATIRVANLNVATSNLVGPGGPTLGNLRLGSLKWGADAVLVRAGLTRPEMLEITPVGLHPVRLNDGPPNPVTADHLHLRMTGRPNGPPRAVDIDAVTIAVSLPGRGLVSAGQLSIHAEFRPDARRDQAFLTFSASAEPLSLPPGAHFALGREVSELAVDGALNGPWPSEGSSLTARATAWRDDGGSLELRRLLIAWGEARLDATATLALDEDLQPMGAGAGKITGFGVALDAMAANAVLTRSAAQAAKAVLTLLANTPADDQPEAVEVPLTLQFRTLSVRQVPLARLPELDWPEQ